MKATHIKTLVSAIALACSALAGNAMANTGMAPAANSLVYSYDEMFQFDIEAFLLARAPHLLPHAEAISHWAGYTSISPKVLLALMEQQSGVLSKGKSDKAANQRPFGALARTTGFANQIRDVADQLANQMYGSAKASGAAEFGAEQADTHPLQALFDNRLGSDASLSAESKGATAMQEFAQTYQRLFGKAFTQSAPQLAINNATLAGPANGVLQFPFPVGASWHVGGAHTNTGSGNYPMSSLDMSQGGGWGSNQSGVWVSSSAAGSFKRHSSCFAEIVHAGGWSTTYYHLMNIQYNTGANVNKNVKIANPANTKAQALCNGGASTGPHEHFSLKNNGSWYHLNGVYLSGWQITATGTSYDTNCNRFYLTKNGTKKCSGYFTN